MLAEERFGQILNLLSKQRTATVQELCEALGTSESTIRRDLTELDRLGKLNKVHGGATLPDSRFQAEEPTMQAKETLAVPQKRAIAAAAAALIHAEDFVFIDAGSTTLELVRALEGEALQANYVTNGVAHARTLAQKGCRVFLPGGLLRPQTEADVIIYAGSLVNPELLSYAKPGCEIHNSATMTLEEVIAVMRDAEAAGKTTVRLHTGDSSIYGAVREQFDELEKLQISYDVCPGVSAFCGAAAALKAEYTLPDVSQTVIITRAAGKTPVPEKESIRSLAAHQATMVLFLSTSLTEQLQKDLLAGGYAENTPAAVVYKATWRDQKIFRCTVGTLHETVTQNGLTKTSLIVVGGCLGGEYMRSLLYHPGFSTEFREASE